MAAHYMAGHKAGPRPLQKHFINATKREVRK